MYASTVAQDAFMLYVPDGYAKTLDRNGSIKEYSRAREGQLGHSKERGSAMGCFDCTKGQQVETKYRDPARE